MKLLSASQMCEVVDKSAQIAAEQITSEEGFQFAVISAAAQLLAERIEEKAGDLASLIVLPMKTVEVMVALSAKQVPTYLPIVRTAQGKHGCRLSDVLTHIATRTDPPTGTEAKAKFANITQAL